MLQKARPAGEEVAVAGLVAAAAPTPARRATAGTPRRAPRVEPARAGHCSTGRVSFAKGVETDASSLSLDLRPSFSADDPQLPIRETTRCYNLPDDGDVLKVTSETNKRRELVPMSVSAAN